MSSHNSGQRYGGWGAGPRQLGCPRKTRRCSGLEQRRAEGVSRVGLVSAIAQVGRRVVPGRAVGLGASLAIEARLLTVEYRARAV